MANKHQEATDRKRIRHALEFDGQGNKETSTLVPWKPTQHHPERHATAIEQAHGGKKPRNDRGQFTKNGEPRIG